MTEIDKSAPRKAKPKKQTPEERLAALRYNRMMYGPTPNERRPAPLRVDYGSSYLGHPKFQSLMTAFKNGADYQFSVADKGKSYTVSTHESEILFDGRMIFYCRPLNRYESNLLMDRAAMVQYQTNEALVHLSFAVLLFFPELGKPLLSYSLNEFSYDKELLEAGIAAQGPNLLIGVFRHSKAPEKTRR